MDAYNRYVLGNNEFMYCYASYDHSPDVPLHIQDYGYEIFFFLEGNATFSVDGNIYELKPYDVLFVNMRELHAPIFRKPSSYVRKVIIFNPSFLSEFISNDFNPFKIFEARLPGTNNKIEASQVIENGIDRLIDIIEELVEENAPDCNALVKAYMLILVSKMNKLLKVSDKMHESNRHISNIIKYINEHLEEDLSYKSLSGIAYLNPNYLYRLFKEETGFTLHDFITSKRIIKAKELLVNNMAMDEIAKQTGFNDYSNFYRTFKKVTGVSPRDFTKHILSGYKDYERSHY